MLIMVFIFFILGSKYTYTYTYTYTYAYAYTYTYTYTLCGSYWIPHWGTTKPREIWATDRQIHQILRVDFHPQNDKSSENPNK
jgi:hypothetical protein